jgi:hypothetical protein
MRLELSRDQESHLELISLHVGKPTAQILTEAAHYLFENDMAFLNSIQQGFYPGSQQFLSPEELDRRFDRILGRARPETSSRRP